MNDRTITFVILGLFVVVFVVDRLPVGLVAIGTAVALWATGEVRRGGVARVEVDA